MNTENITAMKTAHAALSAIDNPTNEQKKQIEKLTKEIADAEWTLSDEVPKSWDEEKSTKPSAAGRNGPHAGGSKGEA